MDTVAASVWMLPSLLLLAVISPSVAYPGGAPVTACQSMRPGHNISTLHTVASPFSVSVVSSGNNCYNPGKPLTVTLRSTDGTIFMGFLMQARRPNDNSTSYGTFAVGPDPKVKSIACFGVQNSAMTHNMRLNSSQTSFTWTPPSTMTDSIVLTTTVVKKYDEVWLQSVTLSLTQCPPTNGSFKSNTWAVSTILAAVLMSVVMSVMLHRA